MKGDVCEIKILLLFICLCTELPHHQPLITGIRSRYHNGDILRGNCTSRHSKPAANLTWTVNNEEVSKTKTTLWRSYTHKRTRINEFLPMIASLGYS